uniref:Uncharacterized protein n=1 Tax=Gasterosteus aculeatus aculeatus TaxID=481459 RepID=A0AAQ4R9C5_GASAC
IALNIPGVCSSLKPRTLRFSPSCKLTKTCSLEPTANLSCKNTFDMEYTQMFSSWACCDEVSLRLPRWIALGYLSFRASLAVISARSV